MPSVSVLKQMADEVEVFLWNLALYIYGWRALSLCESISWTDRDISITAVRLSGMIGRYKDR